MTQEVIKQTQNPAQRHPKKPLERLPTPAEKKFHNPLKVKLMGIKVSPEKPIPRSELNLIDQFLRI